MSAFTRLPQQSRAILLMIGAIFCFTAMDACAKGIAQNAGPVQALWARYAGQATLVILIVLPRIRTVARTNFPGLQLARSVFLMCATVCFFFGISRVGLAEATAVMDVNPVLITLGAALFLGEAIGPRRVIAIAASLIGALIVIRPGTDVFSPWSLLPLGAAFFYSAYSLVTRFVGRAEDAWTSLLYTALFGAVILTAVVPFHWQPLDAFTVGLMLLLAGFGTIGQLMLIRALTEGEASMLAPFGYVGLVFAIFWGVAFFDDFPDVWTLVGALVIVGAGLYVWHRERRDAISGAEEGGSECRATTPPPV